MPDLLARLGLALKAATSIIFAGSRTSYYGGGRSTATLDMRETVADGSGSSLVMAVVFWLCRTFPEAPVRVSAVDRKGQRIPQPLHPLSKLLARPNPFYSGVLLWMATLADWTLNGNGYWLKVRARAGNVVQLWWAPSWTLEPRWPEDGSQFISHYDYRPDMRYDAKPYAVADVVHFRNGLDPRNMRKGLGPLGTLIREIFTDEAAAAFTSSLLRNLGVPGVVVSPPAGGEAYAVGPEAAEAIKAGFESRFGGDNVGRTLVLGQPMDVRVLSFNPEQMQLRNLRQISEERVTAVLGIPAIVVGLGAGLARSTFANYAEAREAAYEQNVVPTQRLLAEELNTQLVPDFVGNPETLVIDFDLSQVRVLQPDQDALHARTRDDFMGGLIMLDEALQEIGREPLDGGRGQFYLRPSGVTPVLAADLLTVAEIPEPAPIPAALAPFASPADPNAPPTAADQANQAPPPKARKAAGERITPDGAADPLGDVPEPEYDEAERKRLARLWDDAVRADHPEHVGRLDAVALNGNGSH